MYLNKVWSVCIKQISPKNHCNVLNEEENARHTGIALAWLNQDMLSIQKDCKQSNLDLELVDKSKYRSSICVAQSKEGNIDYLNNADIDNGQFSQDWFDCLTATTCHHCIFNWSLHSLCM